MKKQIPSIAGNPFAYTLIRNKEHYLNSQVFNEDGKEYSREEKEKIYRYTQGSAASSASY